jgi:hypothetical protein
MVPLYLRERRADPMPAPCGILCKFNVSETGFVAIDSMAVDESRPNLSRFYIAPDDI